METRDFKQIVVPGTHEIVFAKVVKDKPDLELRLYLSVNNNGVSRGVGKDAIRFVIYSTKYCRALVVMHEYIESRDGVIIWKSVCSRLMNKSKRVF